MGAGEEMEDGEEWKKEQDLHRPLANLRLKVEGETLLTKVELDNTLLLETDLENH